jgi:hypothetical protein
MITIHCASCGEYYQVPNSKDKNIVDLTLRYARCTHCGVLRNPACYSIPRKKGRCEVCNAKTRKVHHVLCEKHYVAKWKREHDYNKYMRDYRRRKKLLHNSENATIN